MSHEKPEGHKKGNERLIIVKLYIFEQPIQGVRSTNLKLNVDLRVS